MLPSLTGRSPYTYTPACELLTKIVNGQTTTYKYDVLGNLISVTLDNGTMIKYLIDGQNRRVGKKVNGELIKGWFYRDELNTIAGVDNEGNIISQFVYADHPHVPAYMIKNGTIYLIISDHLGSPRVIVNVETGEIAQRLDYDEFGNILQDTNPGFQPFGFAGGRYDPDTKLVRFGARDYSAEIVRWTTKEPLRFAVSLNFYTYASNDPVNRIDPTGLYDWKDYVSALPDAAVKAPKPDIMNPNITAQEQATNTVINILAVPLINQFLPQSSKPPPQENTFSLSNFTPSLSITPTQVTLTITCKGF
ncbi:RHS repeat-associated core domain-containing protein [Deltaproteobacteria bacterium TL4]